ncbi:hypothetical protein TNCT_411591 [Trichonephila clavata]|uniref:Uncharacterized protein n=1 Tax=Trichonephila clavata TaxID=2740835 RepID=A0A8X6KFX8_TRICU|nr:hypothetical protein TNCT_411591 [Trichonephila clavata]
MNLYKWCRLIESLLRRHIMRTRFKRLSNVSTVLVKTAFKDIRALICDIVIEEHKTILPEMQYNNKEEHDSTSDIAFMVQDVVMKAIAPLFPFQNDVILFLDATPLMDAQSQLSRYQDVN